MAIDTRFAEQARSFITETIKQEIPAANVDSGSAINSIMARGGSSITASLLQEIDHLLNSRDLSDPESLTEADMELVLGNLLVDRDGGKLAYGFVSAYYRDRVLREFPSGTTATTETREVNFVTLVDLTFEPEDYLLDTDQGLYYINLPVVAEEAGEEYNVDAGEVNQLVGDSSGPVSVTNRSSIRSGRDKQTNTQYLRKGQRSVSTRTPLSRDGATYWMQELFGSRMRDLLVVGLGDDEMLRDEVYDLGEGSDPRFQIGVDGLDPVTREQLGSAQSLHVGGRTDLYLLFDGVNYVQQHVDLFADMLLDTDISTPASVTSLQATFVEGTTGQVASPSGKLILDLGNENEETLYYNNVTRVGITSSYIFSLLEPVNPTQIHAVGASVKVVNNGELGVGEDGDIDVLPVFQIAEIRLLDPITLEPIGNAIPETTADSSEPGWYVTKSNPYDLLSARETKFIVLDEKRGVTGNQGITGTNGSTADYVLGTQTYTKYTHATSDFTGYEGREIVFTGSAEGTRAILQVISATEIVVANMTAAGSGVDFAIEDNFTDYIEYPVRVSFYTNTEIQEAQEFLDTDGKRIVSGDILARMFMPVFLDFTMSYRGDGAESQVREAINEVLKTSSGDAIGESEGARFEYSDLINAAYDGGLANYVVTPFEVRIRRLQLDGTWVTEYVNPGANTVNSLAVKVAPDVTFFTGTGSYGGTTNVLSDSTNPFVDPTDEGRVVWIENVGLATITNVVNSSEVELDTTFESTESGVNWSFVASFIEVTKPASVSAFTIPSTGKLMLGAFTSNQETVEYLAVETVGDDHIFILKSGQGIHFTHAVDEPLRVSVDDYDDDNVIADGVITNERNYRPFLGQAVIEKLT